MRQPLRIVIVGIGNILRGDDGVGVAIAARLKEHLRNKPNVKIYEVGESPENYLDKITADQPDIIYLIDAGEFGGKPGEFRIFSNPRPKTQGFSTHSTSLSLVINFLTLQTTAQVYLLAIQPEKIGLGEDLSPAVTKGMEEATQFLEAACQK
ncbi:MAG: hydrogenase maturation protease [Candidatus Omnitrophota bacterium]